MYEMFETKSNDVCFTCQFCDDIFVSEAGIKNHIKEHHEVEVDLESEKYMEATDMKHSEKEYNKTKRGDKSLPWWIEDTYYVCDHCYEIFSNRLRLKSHLWLKHNFKNKDDDIREVDQAESTKKNLKLLASVSPASSKARKKPLLKNKITKYLKPTNKILKQVPSNLSTTEKYEGLVDGIRSKPRCLKCGKICGSVMHLKNHLLSHYYSTLYKFLPTSKPFSCPECSQISRDKVSLTRHFAFTHKKIFQLTDVTEEMLLLK